MVLRRNTSSSLIQCGDEAKAHYLFDDGYLNFNHGSFGAIPASIRDLQRSYQDASEKKPDVFIRWTFPKLLSEARTALASHVQCPKNTVVFVPNATVAANTVFRNLVFQPGDVALYFSVVYGSVEKTLLYLTEITPLRLHRIPLTLPSSDEGLVSLFDDAVAAVRAGGLNPKLAVYDTVSSLPGVRMPFEALTAVCRREGILSFIDAAHGVGHIPLNIAELDPDFLCTNLHKWLPVPRPCCVLYVPARNQALIRTSVPTGHGFVPKHHEGNVANPLPAAAEPLTPFEINFEFPGTLDSTAYAVVPAGLAWRKRLAWGDKTGDEAVFAYCHQQAREVGKLVSERLGTGVLENDEKTLGNCCFTNVRLPLDYGALSIEGRTGQGEPDLEKIVQVARWIEEILVNEYGTFIAVIWHAGAWWVRLSAQVYLTMEDWEKGAGWLKAACDRAAKKQW